MFLTWITPTFLALMGLSILLAWAVPDRRVHIGVVTFALAWVASMLARHFFGSVGVIIVDIPCNLLVAYVFWQLHLGDEGDERGPVWPVPIIVAELAIFASHVTSVTFGLLYYIYITNILFAAELLYMIGLCVMKIVQNRGGGPGA